MTLKQRLQNYLKRLRNAKTKEEERKIMLEDPIPKKKKDEN